MEREASFDPVALASLLAQVDTLESEVTALLDVLHTVIEPAPQRQGQHAAEVADETRHERADLA